MERHRRRGGSRAIPDTPRYAGQLLLILSIRCTCELWSILIISCIIVDASMDMYIVAIYRGMRMQGLYCDIGEREREKRDVAKMFGKPRRVYYALWWIVAENCPGRNLSRNSRMLAGKYMQYRGNSREEMVRWEIWYVLHEEKVISSWYTLFLMGLDKNKKIK